MVREFPSHGTFKANVNATRSKNTAMEQSSPKLEESRDFSPEEKMPNEGEQTLTSADIILTDVLHISSDLHGLKYPRYVQDVKP